MTRPLSRIAPATFGAVAVSLLALKWAPLPYLWICLTWAGVGALTTWATEGWQALVACLCASVVAALAIAEGLSVRWVRRAEANGVHYPVGYFQRDADLGTTPAKGATVRVGRWHDGAPIYNVVYTIDSTGLRQPPPARASAPPRRCVLFFGDSFMFGEGLDNDQTIPYRVSVIAAGQVRGYNIAFHGWGAGQMLSALEHNRVDRLIDCRPTNAIYEAIPDHVARAGGFYAWGRHSPRYELTPGPGGAETLRFVGHFDDADRPLTGFAATVAAQLQKSYFLRWLLALDKTPTSKDVERYLAIVDAASRLLATKYPGVQFDILLWQRHQFGKVQDRVYQQIRDGLMRDSLRVHLVNDLLPGYLHDPWLYELPYDTHPNALADNLLAHYVVRVLLALPATAHPVRAPGPNAPAHAGARQSAGRETTHAGSSPPRALLPLSFSVPR